MVPRPSEQEHVLRNAARYVVRTAGARCLKGLVGRLDTEDAHCLLETPLNDGALGARNVHQGVHQWARAPTRGRSAASPSLTNSSCQTL